jgi:hypothetical protein
MVFPEFCQESPSEATPLSGPEVVSKLLPELRGAQKEGVEWMANAMRQVPSYNLRYSKPRDAFACLAQLLARQ